MAKKVLFWGRFDPGYSRNRVYAALFRELGWEVEYFFVKWFPKFGDVVRICGQLNVVGIDNVELAPSLDPTGRSTALACTFLRESLLALTWK